MLTQNPLLSPMSKTAEEYQADTRKLLNMGGPAYLKPQEEKTAASVSVVFRVDPAQALLGLSDADLLSKMAQVPELAELIAVHRDFAILDTDCKVAAQTGDPELIAVTEYNKALFLKAAGETGIAPAPPGAPSQNLRTTSSIKDPTRPTTTTTRGELLGSFLK